jgi:hypothetical protein
MVDVLLGCDGASIVVAKALILGILVATSNRMADNLVANYLLQLLLVLLSLLPYFLVYRK